MNYQAEYFSKLKILHEQNYQLSDSVRRRGSSDCGGTADGRHSSAVGAGAAAALALPVEAVAPPSAASGAAAGAAAARTGHLSGLLAAPWRRRPRRPVARGADSVPGHVRLSHRVTAVLTSQVCRHRRRLHVRCRCSIKQTALGCRNGGLRADGQHPGGDANLLVVS